jgi:hypothetical protein
LAYNEKYSAGGEGCAMQLIFKSFFLILSLLLMSGSAFSQCSLMQKDFELDQWEFSYLKMRGLKEQQRWLEDHFSELANDLVDADNLLQQARDQKTDFFETMSGEMVLGAWPDQFQIHIKFLESKPEFAKQIAMLRSRRIILDGI